MTDLQEDKIKAIAAIWTEKAIIAILDDEESPFPTELTPELQEYWLSLTTAQRREIRRDYCFEVQDE